MLNGGVFQKHNIKIYWFVMIYKECGLLTIIIAYDLKKEMYK